MKILRFDIAVVAACALVLCARPAAAQTPQVVGNFGVIVKTDPITDDNQSMAIVSTEDEAAGVAWQCWEGRATVWVKLHNFTGQELDAVYRFGTAAPDSTVLMRVENSDELYVIPEDLVYGWSQWSMSSPRLVLRVFDADRKGYDYVFDLSGSGRALRQLPCVTSLRPPVAGTPIDGKSPKP